MADGPIKTWRVNNDRNECVVRLVPYQGEVCVMVYRYDEAGDVLLNDGVTLSYGQLAELMNSADELLEEKLRAV